MMMGHFSPLGGGANCRVNALIAAAAAQIARHGGIDLGVGGRRGFGKQGRGVHDLAGLAVAALRHADIAPRHLHGVTALASSPSIVTTFLPATSDIGVVQERTASPLMCTVQAPHNATPQPNLVPVRPSSSRKYHMSGIEGSPPNVRSCPLTWTFTMSVFLHLSAQSVFFSPPAENALRLFNVTPHSRMLNTKF